MRHVLLHLVRRCTLLPLAIACAVLTAQPAGADPHPAEDRLIEVTPIAIRDLDEGHLVQVRVANPFGGPTEMVLKSLQSVVFTRGASARDTEVNLTYGRVEPAIVTDAWICGRPSGSRGDEMWTYRMPGFRRGESGPRLLLPYAAVDDVRSRCEADIGCPSALYDVFLHVDGDPPDATALREAVRYRLIVQFEDFHAVNSGSDVGRDVLKLVDSTLDVHVDGATLGGAYQSAIASVEHSVETPLGIGFESLYLVADADGARAPLAVSHASVVVGALDPTARPSKEEARCDRGRPAPSGYADATTVFVPPAGRHPTFVFFHVRPDAPVQEVLHARTVWQELTYKVGDHVFKSRASVAVQMQP